MDLAWAAFCVALGGVLYQGSVLLFGTPGPQTETLFGIWLGVCLGVLSGKACIYFVERND